MSIFPFYRDNLILILMIDLLAYHLIISMNILIDRHKLKLIVKIYFSPIILHIIKIHQNSILT